MPAQEPDFDAEYEEKLLSKIMDRPYMTDDIDADSEDN